MLKSTRRNKTGEIPQVFMGEAVFEIKTEELSHGVNPLQWALDEENPDNVKPNQV
jgi:hypothetical protein